ncbi:DUF1330 domain-containing protein [Pigmentiphaga sp. H8]|uniref:DUF1330 domain-containing protein n=1 Tax=unclassified Pigmentiphaga TaxID=2626614 RepID=UPI000F5A4B7B|nr:DUF1330 domain-containing protein [Pigmentiphaga sp. H8]AZG10695.1 DUF1330 domain-containing protein [Pigmentiphaga sp. H8]
MAAYVIGEVKILKPAEMGEYGRMVAEAVAAHGGRYLARGAEPVVLEGGPAHNVLLIEFPDKDAALAWYASPAYQAARKLREGKSNLRLIVI